MKKLWNGVVFPDPNRPIILSVKTDRVLIVLKEFPNFVAKMLTITKQINLP